MIDFPAYCRLIPDGLKRAAVNKAMRWAGTVAGTAAATWLIGQHIDAVTAHKLGLDITNLAIDATPLVIPMLTLWLGQKDVKKVDQQIKNVRATTADAVATAARVGNGAAASATAEAIKKGSIVIVGEPSNVASEREVAVTAALNTAQLITGSGGGQIIGPG